jgi:hypothetical protein
MGGIVSKNSNLAHVEPKTGKMAQVEAIVAQVESVRGACSEWSKLKDGSR